MIVKSIVEDIAWMGYSRVILMTDNKPAIVKVLQESLDALKVEGLAGKWRTSTSLRLANKWWN